MQSPLPLGRWIVPPANAVYDNKNHELLSRSHQRFTHEQKVLVFRSIVKAARLHDSSVELNLYLNPVQNYQWKYRQERRPNAQRVGFLESLQVQIPIAIRNADVQSAVTAI